MDDFKLKKNILFYLLVIKENASSSFHQVFY
jgi:hypothetical protein